jgi:hypothetical protein
MNRDKYATFIDWFFANQEEYEALSAAEDGNPVPLADFIEANGYLATKEAQAYVASQIKGEKKKRGAKRTVAQQAKEIGIFGLLRDIQREFNCGEHTARNVFLDRHSDICSNEDTLKTHVNRAKNTLEKIFGRKPGKVVQETENPEPE